MTRIFVLGHTGRMGTLVADEISKRQDCTRVADMALADVVIDFTVAAATAKLAADVVAHNKPYVCCTTGIDMAIIDDVAKSVPVIHANNTGISLAVFKKSVADMAKRLPDYTVHIHEEHHIHKKDAPSGTAKALGEAVGRPVTYTSVRAGNIVGEHTVIFAGADETIRMHHSVTDRRVFARGIRPQGCA